MFVPILGSRVEQAHDGTGFRVDAGKVAAFVKIAVGTRRSQIVEFVAAAALRGMTCST